MSRSEAYVEDKDTPEHPLDGLGDVSPRALRLGSGTKTHRIKAFSHALFPVSHLPSTYIATSSIDWKLKAAWTMTDKMAKNLSVPTSPTNPARAMEPGFFQYWNPLRVPSGPPPRVITRPVMMSPIISETGGIHRSSATFKETQA